MVNNRIVLFVLIILIGCKNANNKREVLQLISPPKEVEKTMLAVHSLLDSIAFHGDVVGYFFDENNSLHINGKLQYELTDSLTIKDQSNLIVEENKKNFLNNIILLRKNNIFGGYYDKSLGVFLYNYKPTKSNSYEDLLYLIVQQNSDIIDYKNDMEELIQKDKIDNLYLVKPVARE